jgi:hypothetical protein
MYDSINEEVVTELLDSYPYLIDEIFDNLIPLDYKFKEQSNPEFDKKHSLIDYMVYEDEDIFEIALLYIALNLNNINDAKKELYNYDIYDAEHMQETFEEIITQHIKDKLEESCPEDILSYVDYEEYIQDQMLNYSYDDVSSNNETLSIQLNYDTYFIVAI